MAVIDALRGVGVCIKVDGTALQEYTDPEDQVEERVVTRYVEAESDKYFEVDLYVGSNTTFKGDTLQFAVSADGTEARSALVFVGEKFVRGVRKVIEGRNETAHTIRKFRFANLQTTESANTSTSEGLKELGTITVKVWHAIRGKKAKGKHSPKPFTQSGPVPEKALKGQATSHRVSFGDPVNRPKPRYWDTTLIDPEDQPVATFHFLYRSREALKAMLIIPRTPSPAPQPGAEALERRDITTLTQDELRELQRRAREAMESREQKVKVKQEQRPNSPRRRKTRRSGEVTTIELDDDGEVIRETTTSATPDADTNTVVELDG